MSTRTPLTFSSTINTSLKSLTTIHGKEINVDMSLISAKKFFLWWSFYVANKSMDKVSWILYTYYIDPGLVPQQPNTSRPSLCLYFIIILKAQLLNSFFCSLQLILGSAKAKISKPLLAWLLDIHTRFPWL